MIESVKMRRVLVVDDDPAIRKVLIRELRSTFEVIEADSYANAATLLAQPAHLCAVVCDCNLGGGPSGLDLMAHARRVAPGLPRVTVSGNVTEDEGRQLIETGVSHVVIAKPWRGGEVRQAIEHLLSTAATARTEAAVERAADCRGENETEAAAILRLAIDGFWTVDMQGRFLDVNEAYCRMIGYSRAELMGMAISDVEALEKPEETVRRIQQIERNGWDRFETKHRCKDGRVIDVEVSVNYLGGQGGRLFTFLRDVTERNALIAERDRLIERLRASSTELATLRGLIPICMHCKNIRNDQGYWTQVEQFIAARSGAEFTHCVCPACFARHFGDGDAPK